MPRKTRDTEQEPRDLKQNDREEENRFSQEHDDQAGRIWHGLNSEIERDQAGRFEEDEDAEPPTLGRTERV
jgi:hypothetical protein